MPHKTVDLNKCPSCHGETVYEKPEGRSGLVRLHVLPGGDLEFLCPEVPATKPSSGS
jgi:hypothetical protein